jgi:hypothetical protein
VAESVATLAWKTNGKGSDPDDGRARVSRVLDVAAEAGGTGNGRRKTAEAGGKKSKKKNFKSAATKKKEESEEQKQDAINQEIPGYFSNCWSCECPSNDLKAHPWSRTKTVMENAVAVKKCVGDTCRGCEEIILGQEKTKPQLKADKVRNKVKFQLDWKDRMKRRAKKKKGGFKLQKAGWKVKSRIILRRKWPFWDRESLANHPDCGVTLEALHNEQCYSSTPRYTKNTKTRGLAFKPSKDEAPYELIYEGILEKSSTEQASSYEQALVKDAGLRMLDKLCKGEKAAPFLNSWSKLKAASTRIKNQNTVAIADKKKEEEQKTKDARDKAISDAVEKRKQVAAQARELKDKAAASSSAGAAAAAPDSVAVIHSSDDEWEDDTLAKRRRKKAVTETPAVAEARSKQAQLLLLMCVSTHTSGRARATCRPGFSGLHVRSVRRCRGPTVYNVERSNCWKI